MEKSKERGGPTKPAEVGSQRKQKQSLLILHNYLIRHPADTLLDRIQY